MNLSDAAILDGKNALSADHQRVAEIINDYDPDLFLIWIPPKDRSEEDREPFAILHVPPNAPPYIAMFLKESEVNANLLARVFLHDNKNANVLDRLDAMDAARRAMSMKQQMEEAERRKEFMTTVLKSPLHTFRHDGIKYE